jgi:FAD/FMN-containing dehydrogenase
MTIAPPVSRINAQKIARLSENFAGKLVSPSDAGYEHLRRVFNLLVDMHPALIARCATEDDILAALAFGIENDLPVAIRGGGHNYAGKGTCEGGVVLDLSPMKAVEIDPRALTVKAQSGLMLIELDRLLQAVGLALPVGVVAETGMAGLALGGGLGWLMGKYGLTIDHMLELEVILADGRKVIANETENSDLFWGLRGGGHLFGVVTSFKFRVRRHSEILFGSLCYPAERARELIEYYAEVTADIPDELSLMGGLIPMLDGHRFRLLGCWNGDLDEGARMFDKLRGFGVPVLDTVQKTTYLKMQESAFPLPPRLRHYVRSSFMGEITPAIVETSMSHIADSGPTCALMFQSFHGQATRVPLEATPFPYRKKGYVLEVQAAILDEESVKPLTGWVDNTFTDLDRLSDHVAYVNYLTVGEDDRVPEAYGPHWQRLSQLKRKYDPDNVFRVNFNVPPAD